MASFTPEIIGHLGFFPITNTLLDTFFVDALLVGGTFAITKNLSLVPQKAQNAAEALLETFYDLTTSVAQNRTARIFPYFMTFFLFILLANWSGLLPGVGTIGFFHGTGKEKEFIPLLRSATSDINTTLALALISAVATHMLSIQITGIKDYISRYLSFNPLNLFIGILEIVGELTKVVSLSFRLFGNVFAGEVVLLTVSGIFAFFFPLPFMLLEVIVGVVQALVFAMLTMAFMAILTTPHHHVEGVEARTSRDEDPRTK